MDEKIIEFYKFLILISSASDQLEQFYDDLVKTDIERIKNTYNTYYYAKYEACVEANMNNLKKQERACNKIAAEKTRVIKEAVRNSVKNYSTFRKVMKQLSEGMEGLDSTYLQQGKTLINEYITDHMKVIK